MRKNQSFLLICIFLALSFLTSCSGKNPMGVVGEGKETYYIISLPSGESVGRYFTRVGTETEKAIWDTENDTKTVIYISEVKEGGWIVYRKNLVAYIPPECGERMTESASVNISIARGTDNCMSLDEAKEYISFLKD